MIREATPNDVKALSALYKELMTYHNELDPEKYAIPDDEACEMKMRTRIDLSFEKYGMIKFLCHESDGILDAYAIHMACSLCGTVEKSDGFLSIEELIVHKNAQRKGIGSELVCELIRIAKEKHCETIDLNVYINNESAKRFYEKNGLLPKLIKMEMRLD